MPERDLDQYLEGLGIDVNEEEGPQHGHLLDTPEEDPLAAADDFPFEDQLPDHDDEHDMEAALEPTPYAFGVIPDELTPTERTESFLVNLLLQLDPTYAVEVSMREGEIQAEVFGGDYGRIIGKGGRTLSALEFLTNAVVNRSTPEPMRVVIDVGGYKRRRDERLRQTAFKAATRVRKTGEPVELEPMSAAERRVVHMAVADDAQVVSESTGEGRARRVVLRPID